MKIIVAEISEILMCVDKSSLTLKFQSYKRNVEYSLGRFLVTKEHGNRNKRGFRIKGMDLDNQSAYMRGLMIHGAKWIDTWCWKEHIPLNGKCCSGCVTVSSKGMNYLWSLVNEQKRPLLLWNFTSSDNRS